ncbi:hypothetical protein BASA83_000473 [Batrachochytrium salamandrivorans]|nr:hypothetical protein BASA83_000473 [Batrachochytrium salamandrivorans]
MQLFHLFSFVVVASYAVALPQPAGLSEKYSNNVDTNLVSGLEARSYQPVLNSYKESATLMSLERRANSGSGSSPSFVKVPKRPFSDIFTDDMISSKNLAYTIDKVGNGIVGVFKKGELVIQKIGGGVGDRLARYIRREAYVNAALAIWIEFVSTNVVNFIKSGLGDDEYSKIEPELVEHIEEFQSTFSAESKEAIDAATKILNKEGTVIENVEKISTGFYSASSACTWIFSGLDVQLVQFRAGSTLSGYMANASQSVNRFNTVQLREYRKILKLLEDEYSQ